MCLSQTCRPTAGAPLCVTLATAGIMVQAVHCAMTGGVRRAGEAGGGGEGAGAGAAAGPGGQPAGVSGGPAPRGGHYGPAGSTGPGAATTPPAAHLGSAFNQQQLACKCCRMQCGVSPKVLAAAASVTHIDSRLVLKSRGCLRTLLSVA